MGFLSGGTLRGMKELCSYLNRSEATVLRWIQQWGFPAERNVEGEWEGRKGDIEEWLTDMKDIGVMPEKEPGPGKKKPKAVQAHGRW